MNNIFDIIFSGLDKQPRWMKNFESRIDEISARTYLSKKELRKIAEVLNEMRIIDEKQ